MITLHIVTTGRQWGNSYGFRIVVKAESRLRGFPLLEKQGLLLEDSIEHHEVSIGEHGVRCPQWQESLDKRRFAHN